jgi:hypothetical protein
MGDIQPEITLLENDFGSIFRTASSKVVVKNNTILTFVNSLCETTTLNPTTIYKPLSNHIDYNVIMIAVPPNDELFKPSVTNCWFLPNYDHITLFVKIFCDKHNYTFRDNIIIMTEEDIRIFKKDLQRFKSYYDAKKFCDTYDFRLP